ncbi:hypothetical protein [Actinoalloteichus caeruleus]|uniref:Uncharacterized protein n=1 Tax=Actinoalloteichus caeruleus DSM 43889 TaxID=1120930 RepID=A0ABT1JI50_ACTCY|nr:hypothetical protein [Actinoalloteichus caeruleus]MCP2331874.1 hypothetical protein [Actinoalloteichus caeruleus DSM 43889]
MSDPRPDDGLPEAGRRLLDELGQLLDTVHRRAEPWAAQLRGRAEEGERHGPSCVGCPVCAVSGLVRGDRPDLGVKVADQLLGLLAVVRSALDETSPAPGATAGARENRTGDRTAQEPSTGGRDREDPPAAPDGHEDVLDVDHADPVPESAWTSGAVPRPDEATAGDPVAPSPSPPADAPRVRPIAVRWEDGC